MWLRSTEPWLQGRSYALALFRDWRTRYCLRRSLQAMASDDRDRMLRENGVDAAELEICLNTVFGSEDLLERLMRQLGLDADRLRMTSPPTMRDLERTCMACRSRRRCRSHLVQNEAAAQFRNYCPNAVALDSLRADA